GSSIESLVRSALDAGDESLALEVAAELADTIMTDRTATLVMAHLQSSVAGWYRWLLVVQEYATLFGQFQTVSDFFMNAAFAEGSTTTFAGEYHSRWLHRRLATPAQNSGAIQGLVQQTERRGAFDAMTTLASIGEVLGIACEHPLDEL